MFGIFCQNNNIFGKKTGLTHDFVKKLFLFFYLKKLFWQDE
jgi:hypothetical protein